MSNPPSNYDIARLAIIFAIITGAGAAAWIYGGRGGSAHIVGHWKYTGPSEVCYHKLDKTMDRPIWGPVASPYTEIGTNPNCLLNLEIPQNWDCWPGNTGPGILSRLFPKWFRPEIHRYTMADKYKDFIMYLPQPVCHRIDKPGSDWPLPLDIVIPTTTNGRPLPPVNLHGP